MGCHTWLYKPCTKSKRRIKKEVISYIEDSLEELYDPLEVERFLSYRDKEEDEYYFSLEALEDLRAFYKVWLRRIQSNHPLWQAAIYSRRFHERPVEYKEGVFYVGHHLHNIFRWKDYNSPNLYSYKQTIMFCKARHIRLSIKQHLQLLCFFYSPPIGGLIRFG